MLKNLDSLREKNIHVVGVSGSEGSALLRILLKNRFQKITAHDFLEESTLEKNFRLYHKGVTSSEKTLLFRQFQSDLSNTTFYSGKNYLHEIEHADAIFVPQSWRLYSHNKPLWERKNKGIPFYSLTRIYLDFTNVTIVAVTGTVGKGSVAHLIYTFLRETGKKTYFAGNDTWMVQLADQLSDMSSSDILVLEVSHRQLLDGFTKPPPYVVVTNVYPNHLDEVKWEEYKELKFSLPRSQGASEESILNFDIPELQQLGKKLKSKVTYFSVKDRNKNTKNVQEIFQGIMNNKSDQYIENILAASALVEKFGIMSNEIIHILAKVKKLPARLEKIGSLSGIDVYDDVKSTTPWATLGALRYLLPAYKKIFLICGGETKNIPYESFIEEIAVKPIRVYVLESPLSLELQHHLPQEKVDTSSGLEEGMKKALLEGNPGDCIVVSPAAAFFYRDFIGGKKSIRKIITSLLQAGQE